MARARALCGLLLAASAVSRPAQPMLTYVTLWKDQMKPWGLDPDANPDALSAWLDQARGAGVSHVMISASWADVEPKEGAFDLAPLLRLIGKIGQKGLLSMVVLDAFRGPQWLFERHPDARPLGGGPPEHPCNKRVRGFTTFAHTEAFAYALRFVSTTVQEINSALGPSAVHSFQPNFNNELEARYTQECDIFLDYSPTTIAAYRQWLRAQNSDASYWSRRWGTQRGPKSGLLWSEEEQDWRWDTIKPPNVFGDTTQSVGLPTPKTQPRTRQTMRTQTPDDEHQPVTSLAYWDWLRFREVQLSRAYRTACDRVVAHGGRGCFLHFGEFFTSIDAINAVIIFELANASSITDIIVDSNFVNFGHLRVDPVMASILVSAAQPYVSGAATGKNLWFEGAAERLELASEVTPRSTDGARHRTTLDGDVEIMRQGFDHAVKAGATGLGITNLKALSFLSSILPAAPADLVVQPWKPKVLLFFPYETFYSFRRWMDKHKRDVMQKYVYHTYVHASSKCECQVQVVADAALLPVLGADRRFEKGRLWLQLPGVMPSAARNAIHSAMREGHWHVIPHSSEHWNITLPVMGRTTVQALPDFVIAGTPKGGTSSLAEWFSAAPWTAPSVQKEINFFDRHFDKGLDWYARHFAPHYGREFNEDAHVFEATPGYIYHPLVPARVFALLPATRIIFALRDPAQRAMSDHAMWTRQGVTPRSFDAMVDACIAVVRERPRALAEGQVYTHVLADDCVAAAARAGEGGAPPDGGFGDLCRCYENIVAKGLYAEQLDRWAAVFPRSQLLAIETDDLARPVDVMTKLCNFLGLTMRGLDTTKLAAVNTAAKPINNVVAGQGGQYAGMSATANRTLAAFYACAPDYHAEWLGGRAKAGVGQHACPD